MKSIILILFGILLTTILLAQDFSLIPYRKGDMWGYSNAEGKIIIKPEYQRTFLFSSSGIAKIKINDKYGFIDKKGKIIIEAKFDKAQDFAFEECLVVVGGKKYCINLKGKMTKTVSEQTQTCLTWDSNEEGVCGNCCVTFKQANKYGIVCKKIDFIDTKQQVTSIDSIPAIYDTIFSSIAYDVEFTPLVVRQNSKYGIVDAKNNIVYALEYDSVNILSYDVFLLKKNGIWNLSNKTKTLYENIQNWKYYLFSSGHYIMVKVNGKWGVIHEEGAQVLPNQFEDIILPSRYVINREFTVKLGNKYGYVNDKVTIPAIYEKLEPFDGYDYTLVTKNGKEGYISLTGKEYFE